MDFVTPEKRSNIMRSIKSRDSKPEIILRKFLFSKGYRYRKNYKKLPGRPDIVFVSKKIAIFVNGCFWHAHTGCQKATAPKRNRDFWTVRRQNEWDSRGVFLKEALAHSG